MRFSIILPTLTLFAGLLLLAEPTLADRFETISGGVRGSLRLKREFVQIALLTMGIGFLVGAVLAVVVPHTNPVFLNFANWKHSAIVMAVIGTVMLVSYLFV